MKIILIFVMLNLNSQLLACSIPDYGSEFDSLINISKNETNNSYAVSLPNKLDNTESAIVYLAYAKTPVGEIFAAEHMKDMKLKTIKNTLSTNLQIEDINGYKPYIHVIWNGRPCGIVANKFIEK